MNTSAKEDKKPLTFWQALKEEFVGLKDIKLLRIPFQIMVKENSWTPIVLAIILTFGQPLIVVLYPYLVRIFTDQLLSEASVINLMALSKSEIIMGSILVIPIMMFFGELFMNAATYISRKACYAMQKEIKVVLFGHVMMLPLLYHDSKKTGEVSQVLSEAPKSIQYFMYTKGFADGFPLTFKNILILVSMAGVSLYLFSIASPFLLIGLFLFILGGRAINKTESKSWSKQKEISGRIVEMLANIFLVKAHKREETEIKAVRTEEEKQQSLLLEQSVNWRKLSMSVAVFKWLGLGISLWFLADGVQSGQYTVGMVFQFTALYYMFSDSFFKQMTLYSDFRRLVPALNEIQGILGKEKENFFNDGLKIKDIKQVIAIRNLWFSYHANAEDENALLKDINCDFPVGQTTMIVGATGCGKTTLIKILFGFYKHYKGSILFDYTDSENLNLLARRNLFSLVDQGKWTLNASVRDNITYGTLNEASDEEVIAAAKIAGAHDFITQDLPQGYDTILGERGVSVSGGQRQRIAIARSLISKAPIIIFDEPASELDPATAAKVWADIRKSLKGKTVIVISHTPLDCENIIVMENGKVIRSGPPKLLEKDSESYRNLFPQFTNK